jgi:CheY-like chemotaxis protein
VLSDWSTSFGTPVERDDLLLRAIAQRRAFRLGGRDVFASRGLLRFVAPCASTMSFVESPTAEGRSHQILVVEDSEDLRLILSALLMRRGFRVLEATNGESAMILGACHSLDGVLTDVEMPGMNGFELCRKLRKLDVTLGRSVPVWIMTGSTSPDVDADARAVGARGVFRKPFDGRVIAETLHVAVAGAAEHSRLAGSA